MFSRGADGAEPVRPDGTGPVEVRRSTRTREVTTGTLACPACDAPVLPGRPLSPGEPLRCGLCDHEGRVRDFLSLAQPTRPAHVVVRVAELPPLVARAPRRRRPQ